MTHDEILRAVDGLMATDSGATDSGTHDPDLEAKLDAHVRSLGDDERRVLLSTVMAELYLSPEALKVGYGWEEAEELAGWYDRQGWRP